MYDTATLDSPYNEYVTLDLRWSKWIPKIADENIYNNV